MLGKFGRSRGVGLLLVEVLTTIQLDYQFVCGTGEVHDAVATVIA